MIVTFHGGQYVKLQVGDTTIAINPTDLMVNKKAHRFGANIALITTSVDRYRGIETVSYGGAEPFVIDGPGEYEVEGINIIGVASSTKKEWLNTSFIVGWDGMRVLVVGNIDEKKEVPAQLREIAGEVDVVIIPVASELAPNADQAYKIAQSFEPHLLMPVSEDSSALATFMKEASGPAEEVEKATLRVRDVQSKEGEVIALSIS